MMNAPLTLRPYPGTRSKLETIALTVAWQPDGALRLSYRVVPGQAALKLPAPKPAAFADGLWQSTCLEAFVGRPGEAAYREFNFSPSGEWAVYAFDAYRERTPGFAPAEPPSLVIHQDKDGLSLEATLPASLLPAPGPEGIELALSAVIEDETGLSYWALAHPAERPDFHHRSGFCLKLPSPGIPS